MRPFLPSHKIPLRNTWVAGGAERSSMQGTVAGAFGRALDRRLCRGPPTDLAPRQAAPVSFVVRTPQGADALDCRHRRGPHMDL